MTHNFDFKELIEDLFRLTGKKMSADDPLAIAAFFYTHQLRQASEVATRMIESAGEGTYAAARDATNAAKEASLAATAAAAVCQKLEAERAALVSQFNDERARSEKEAASRARVLADGIEGRVKKAVRDASRAQSTQEGPPQGWRGVLAGVALGVFIAFGTMLVACNFRLSWFSDARVGAEWASIQPTLPPDLRSKLMEHIQNLNR